MPANSEKHRVRVEEADWANLLSFVRIFRAFRMAISPAKLFLALFLAILLLMSGWVLDAIWGPVVYPAEIVEYATSASNDFQSWLANRDQDARNDLRASLYGLDAKEVDVSGVLHSPDPFAGAIDAINAHYAAEQERLIDEADKSPEVKRRLHEQLETIRRLRRSRVEAIRAIEPEGVFRQSMKIEIDAFERLLGGATMLNLGVGQLLRGQPHDPTSVVGALREMFWIVPGWLLTAHRWFLILYSVIGYLLWSLFGGAIARMAALHATRGERIGPTTALRFAYRRWFRFFVTPLIPAVIVAIIALVLFLFGLLFFGVPYLSAALNMVGATAFVIPILLGTVVALILIGMALASHMLYPALAVEGADGFDANSRTFGYVITQPWHTLFYSLLSLIYGSLTYLFIAGLLFLSLLVAQFFVSAGANLFLSHTGGVGFDQIMPQPEVGRLAYAPDTAALHRTAKIAAVITTVEVHLFTGLLAAYAISFYFSVQTLVYLLLRRGGDGTEFDDVYEPESATPDGVPAAKPPVQLDKVEPNING